MGKGDIRTKRGKISAGSFGNSRPHKVGQPTTTVAKPKAKKAAPSKKAKK